MLVLNLIEVHSSGAVTRTRGLAQVLLQKVRIWLIVYVVRAKNFFPVVSDGGSRVNIAHTLRGNHSVLSHFKRRVMVLHRRIIVRIPLSIVILAHLQWLRALIVVVTNKWALAFLISLFLNPGLLQTWSWASNSLNFVTELLPTHLKFFDVRLHFLSWLEVYLLRIELCNVVKLRNLLRDL